MPILCQFDVKMPLRNLHFFNMSLTPPPLLNNVLKKMHYRYREGHPLLARSQKGFFDFSDTIFPICIYCVCVKSLLCTKSPDDDMMTILWSCGTHTYRNTWQNVSAYRSKHKRAKDVLHSGLSTECKCIIILNKIRRQINLTCELLCTLYLMCVTRWTRLIVHETHFHEMNLQNTIS